MYAWYLLGTRALTYLLTYLLTQLLGGIKPAISQKRLKIDRKLLLTAYIKWYTGFWLPPKCMTLNDLCVRFKVIDSLNAAKMAKYSLLMTPTPCRVAGCIISVISSLLTPDSSGRLARVCLWTLNSHCAYRNLQRLHAVCAATARLLFSFCMADGGRKFVCIAKSRAKRLQGSQRIGLLVVFYTFCATLGAGFLYHEEGQIWITPWYREFTSDEDTMTTAPELQHTLEDDSLDDPSPVLDRQFWEKTIEWETRNKNNLQR